MNDKKDKEKNNGGGLKSLPEAERPREKLMARGPSALSDAELLAILIGSGTRKESALQLALRVLSLEKGGPAAFTGYAPQEFTKLSGIGEAKACVISAAIELGRRIASSPPAVRPRIENPGQAADYCMEEMRRLPKEVFRVLMLNAKSELIMHEDISVGTVNTSFSHPREVFSGAIRRGASSVILVHNHPSGDPTPSSADISTTDILCKAGELLGIRVQDHILIGDGRFVSFRESELIRY